MIQDEREDSLYLQEGCNTQTHTNQTPNGTSCPVMRRRKTFRQWLFVYTLYEDTGEEDIPLEDDHLVSIKNQELDLE